MNWKAIDFGGEKNLCVLIGPEDLARNVTRSCSHIPRQIFDDDYLPILGRGISEELVTFNGKLLIDSSIIKAYENMQSNSLQDVGISRRENVNELNTTNGLKKWKLQLHHG